MSPEHVKFRDDGYCVVEKVVTEDQCKELARDLPRIDNAGSRALLSVEPFRRLAQDIRNIDQLRTLLDGLVAVQCTLFRKSLNHNWAVRLHRDTVVAVTGDGPWRSAGVKDGMKTAKPPRTFLNRCVAVRLHLDGAPEEDVSVVPGSHADSIQHERSRAIAVTVPPGGVLVMRPSIAHASSKMRHSGQRRVLHFLFAGTDLPKAYSWYHAV